MSRLQAVGLVHGAAHRAAYGGTRQRSDDRRKGSPFAVTHLRTEQTAQHAADDHAGLLLGGLAAACG
jgi:hypothetical protein